MPDICWLSSISLAQQVLFTALENSNFTVKFDERHIYPSPTSSPNCFISAAPEHLRIFGFVCKIVRQAVPDDVSDLFIQMICRAFVSDYFLTALLIRAGVYSCSPRLTSHVTKAAVKFEEYCRRLTRDEINIWAYDTFGPLVELVKSDLISLYRAKVPLQAQAASPIGKRATPSGKIASGPNRSSPGEGHSVSLMNRGGRVRGKENRVQMTPQQEALQSPRRSDTANATSTPIFTIPNLKSIKKKRRGAAAFPSPHAHSTPVAIKSEPVQTASLLDRIYGSNTQAQGTTSHALPFAKGFAATSILSSIYPSPVYTQDRCKVEPESSLVLRSAASGSESICTPARKNGARPSTVFDHLATPDSASAGQNDGTGRRSVLPSRIDNLFRLVDSPLPTLAYRPVRVSTYKRKKAHKIGKKPEMLTDSSSGSESSDSFPSLFQRAKSLPCTTANTGRRLIDRIQALDMHAAADQDEEMKMRSSSPTQPEPSLWPEAYPVWLTAGPSTVKLAK